MWRRLAVGLVVLFTLVAPADVCAAPKWSRVLSKNFLLVGDASERDIRQVAIRLEQFRETVSRLLPKASVASPQPTVVLVFDRERSFRPYKPLYQGKSVDVTGYFQGGPDANYIALTLERGEASYPIIFHEYTHLMLRNVMRDPPVWFGEGLAEYYSSFALSADGRKAQIGKPIERHLDTLREHFIPLAELLAVDHSSPLYNEAQRRGVFYAESWAWVHFLLMGRQDRSGELVALVNRLADGENVSVAFRAVFGSDPASFQSHLLNYVQQALYQYASYTLSDPVRFEKEMSAVAISDAEWQAHQGDLLAHMGRLDDAERQIESARALDPKLALTYASLGVVRIRQSRPDEAGELWRQAVALGQAGFGSELARQWLDRARPQHITTPVSDRKALPDSPVRPVETSERMAEPSVSRPASAPQSTLDLRAVRPGEVRVEGDLAQIDCRADGIVFTVKTTDREFRATAKSFADVDFVSFRSDTSGTIPCGSRKPGDRVYLTWVPLPPGAKPPAPGVVGQVVAIEFLPIQQ